MPVDTGVSLTEEPFSAILARVAYRLIQIDHRRRPRRYHQPAAGMCDLADELHEVGLRAMSVWVAAYAFYAAGGTSTASYKQTVVRRARWGALNREYGKPWARVPGR